MPIEAMEALTVVISLFGLGLIGVGVIKGLIYLKGLIKPSFNPYY